MINSSFFGFGFEAFDKCYRLTSIIVDTNNPSFSGGSRVLFDKNRSWLVSYPSASGDYTIPSGVNGIVDDAFDYCTNLTSVTAPQSVTSIGSHAFYNCTKLTKVCFSGSAPSGDNTIFSGESGTVYYLPGSKGWSSTFGGWPTALWYQPKPTIVGLVITHIFLRFDLVLLIRNLRRV
jgi:hypothetical protein